MRLSKLLQQQAGDTIVEVLIAIAVVSLVLVGAYASVNHSSLATEDSQEHNQALKLAQAQVEFLRANGTSGGGCFDQAGAAASGGACKVSANGAPSCTAEPCYNLSITSGGGATAYIVQVNWNSVQATSDTSRITLYYRPEVTP